MLQDLAEAIFKIFKFQWNFEKMYLCFLAIMKFIIMKISIKILIKYYENFHY